MSGEDEGGRELRRRGPDGGDERRRAEGLYADADSSSFGGTSYATLFRFSYMFIRQ